MYSQFCCNVYRGQRNASYQLTPSAMRSNQIQGIDGLILRNTWALLFQRLICSTSLFQEHYTVRLTSGIWETASLFVEDPRILAQHYGLPTTLIDYTLDPEIALFFACTKYNDERNMPLSEMDIRSKPQGRIFLNSYSMSKSDTNFGYPVHVINTTIFSRPTNQLGFLMEYNKNQRITSIVFDHDLTFSEEIFKKYNNGFSLIRPTQSSGTKSLIDLVKNEISVPKDMVNTICQFSRCSRSQVQSCFNRYGIDYVPFIDQKYYELAEQFVRRERIDTICNPNKLIETCKKGHILDRQELYQLFSGLQLSRNWNDSVQALVHSRGYNISSDDETFSISSSKVSIGLH